MPTISELRQQAANIKNATQVGENTATRVGTTFETIADLLEGMGGVANVSTIDIGEIDTLNTAGDMLASSPNIYTLTDTIGGNTFKVGTLFLFANNGYYDVAQVVVSQYFVENGRIDTSSSDDKVHVYYRFCRTRNTGSLPTPVGTWTTWTEFSGEGGGSPVTIDTYPTENSANAVSSGGVFERLADVAPKVDINGLDDIGNYADMLATKSPFYTVTRTLQGNLFRVGTLMVFANQGHYILYQILATDYLLNDDGTLDTTTSINGGLKLIWRMKQFSGNPPAGVTIGVWTTWAKFGDSGYQPDNEDIDLNANGQLQFANKLYDTSAFSGLGRVYLRKNIITSGGVEKNVLTQAMVNIANTIYHIQYDYDLNGQTITLPAGCVLEFNGGSLRNGTLNCNDLTINSTKKCLSNITFSGDFVYGGIVKLDWFITKYATSLNDESIDNTTEVQSAMNCGVRNIEFPIDKYIRLTQTIQVNTAVSILASKSIRRVPESHNANDIDTFRTPCVFSKNVITLFNYNVQSTYESVSIPICIGNITLYIDVPYNNLNNKNIPILNIETNWGDTSVYGLQIDCNIISKRHQVTINVDEEEITYFLLNYTAIKITANRGNLTYIKINGDIFGTYYGVVTSKANGSNAWMTDIAFNNNTWCCYGGILNDIDTVRIFGSHQANTTDTKGDKNYGYFTGYKVNLYGTIWDANSEQPNGLRSASYPIKEKSLNVFYNNVNNKLRPFNSIQQFASNPFIAATYIENNVPLPLNNALWMPLVGTANPTNLIQRFSYTIDNVDIFRSEKLYNGDNLFNENCFNSVLTPFLIGSSAAYVYDAVGSIINISFVINKFGYKSDTFPILFFRNFFVCNVTISHCDTLDGVYEEYYNSANTLSTYYGLITNIFNFNDTKQYIKVDINIDINSQTLILPTLIVLSPVEVPKCTLLNSTIKSKLSSGRNGVQHYNTDYKVPVFWNTDKWLDCYGFTPHNSRGPKSNRPTNLVSSDVGLSYFDTTRGKPIFYNGETWVDAYGTAESRIVTVLHDDIDVSTGVINAGTLKWLAVGNQNYKHGIVQVEGASKIAFTTTADYGTTYVFLKSYNPVTGELADICDGTRPTGVPKDSSIELDLPEDCNFVYFRALDSGNSEDVPETITLTYPIKDAIQVLDERVTALENEINDILSSLSE